MAKAVESGESNQPAKRVKTGGRPAKQSIDEKIEDAIRRGKLAALPDDTTIDAELAAFYLCISLSQLRELRKESLPSEEDKKAARLEKAADAAARAAGRTRKPKEEDQEPQGLRMIKIAEKGAIGSNQPVTYKLGDLRDFQRRHSGYGTFELRLAHSSLLGFVADALPFLAAPKPDRKGRHILQAPGWGMDQDERELALAKAVAGKLKCVWLTPAEAIHQIWQTESEHKKFAKPWLALLKEEISSAKASIERTAIAVASLEGKPAKKRSTAL